MKAGGNKSPIGNFFTSLTSKRAFITISFICLIVNFNALFNNFVEDDKKYIVNYPLVHQINLLFSFSPNYYNAAGQYRAIPALYFSIAYALFGNTPFFYHFIQIGLHIIVSFLVFIIFSRFVSKSIAFFGSLIFLVHPMNVESVAYISTTVVSPMFTLFGFISLLLLIKETITKKELALGLFLLLLSLLSKETAVIFIFLIFLYRFLFKQKEIFKLSIGLFVLLCIYTFLRIVVGKVGLVTRLLVPVASLSLFQRVAQIPLITFYYIKTFFFPNALAFDQQWVVHSINISTFYFPLTLDTLFIVILCFSGFYIFKSHKQYFKPFVFFSAWFFAGFFFHLQIFPLDATVSDRWFYLTMIGLIGLLCIILQSIMFKIQKYKYILIFFALIIIVVLSVRTFVRNSNWHDGITLFTHDIQISDNYDIENSLGTEYLSLNDFPNALIHMERSRDFRQDEFNLHDLGVIYEDIGDMEKAKMYFAEVFHTKDYNLYLPHKHDENSYKSYASVLLYVNDVSQDKTFIQNALSDYPNSPDLWMFLALVQLKLHNEKEAFDAINRSYQLSQNQENTFIYQHVLDNQSFSITLDKKQISFE